MIYFDNAATSWPKPEGVAEAMKEVVEEYGANPGRGGHQLSLKAGRKILRTRVALAKLFHVKNSADIIFFSNATAALNQAIKGFPWQEGDELITTSYEHNSVRRPVEYLKREYGVNIHYIQPDQNGKIDLNKLESTINSHTRLIISTHVSNLTGAIFPIADIGNLAREKGVPFLVDASQSAGMLPIDVQAMKIDLLAFPGHKGLYGPQGTGGLYLSPDLNLIPLLHGGTGSQSEAIDQPDVRPDRYESGTLNSPGIAGLEKGLQFIESIGIDTIYQHEQHLTNYCLNQLKEVNGIQVYGPQDGVARAPVIPINLDGVDASELAHILDQHYSIATRAGMHCTPLAHQSIQTDQVGAVRISFGYFNTLEEIDVLIAALQEISKEMSNTESNR